MFYVKVENLIFLINANQNLEDIVDHDSVCMMLIHKSELSSRVLFLVKVRQSLAYLGTDESSVHPGSFSYFSFHVFLKKRIGPKYILAMIAPGNKATDSFHFREFLFFSMLTL